ncbi:MAG: DNA-3-methyladenine glycosylase I [Gammaproteobacteria bacterium]|jgi:DNA-3-methyladenine glycosylase I|nr:DNA-3-methyladenine glycosylase I [Gammaproteobacteria bacterium]
MVKATRCDWCGDDPLYVAYHDTEWGVPVRDDRALFERLVLEGMQAGLSWYTVLKKRQRMRERFLDFDPGRLTTEGDEHLRDWLEDPGLIRHRGKLESVIGNARAMLALPSSLSDHVWAFVDGAPVQNRWTTLSEVPIHTKASDAMSTSLKRAGFRFVGPTICYAFMQSAGLVNDHLLSCHRHWACLDMGTEWSG